MKRETKIYSNEPQTQSEGSFWELCVFAVLFVVVFTVLARTAHAAPLTKAQIAASKRSSDPNMRLLAQNTKLAATADEDMTVQPLRMQSLPSAVPTGALPSANVSASLPEKDTSKRIVWSSSLIVDTSSELSREDNNSMSGEYLLKTGLTDQKTNVSLLLKAGYDREYTNEQKDGRDGDLVDPSISLTKTWKDGVDFRSPVFDSLFVGLSSVAGASRESARRTFVASVGPKFGMSKKFHRLNFGQVVGYSYKFYNYDIRDDGTVNSPNSFSSVTDLSYDITDSLAISAEMLLVHSINFQNTGVSSEESALSLDYTVSKAFGVSLGVATKRGTISDDGTSNGVKFIDDAVAQGFLDIILNF